MTRLLKFAQSKVVIKVPRLNVSPDNREPHDHLQYVRFVSSVPRNIVKSLRPA